MLLTFTCFSRNGFEFGLVFGVSLRKNIPHPPKNADVQRRNLGCVSGGLERQILCYSITWTSNIQYIFTVSVTSYTQYSFYELHWLISWTSRFLTRARSFACVQITTIMLQVSPALLYFLFRFPVPEKNMSLYMYKHVQKPSSILSIFRLSTLLLFFSVLLGWTCKFTEKKQTRSGGPSKSWFLGTKVIG